ncbi:PD-(D/E)XK nuclease superfamily protein [Ruegeria intermedia]|uniref:PD-(D/E)XK nuclease superfamily protein n=1 Tax=Ruegeria intermedia TaxID=996115 RepID=A0A1M4Z183_9RHOB|nr:nuclease domain-containing protein [Ruegeria intermedia]SHF11821.1 PD-(D/E)XK nuclease superfamily protein [Ruegeria intermedia]
MTHFIIFSGRSTLLEVPLGKSQTVHSFEVQETARIGFEVEDYDERVTYQISIGDIPITEEPQERRSRLEWPASPCLDGASGVTPISLRDVATGDVLARSLALVEPSKLSASAYEAMYADMRRISVELLLDLISKSRLALSQRPSLRSDNVQPLTARLELSQIRWFWNRFSPILADILEDPHKELRHRRSVRPLRPGERLLPDVLRRFANRGLGAREAVRSGALVELPTVMSDRNTRENSVIVAFMDLLWRRVDRSLKRARAERDMRFARMRSFRSDDAALARFTQLREEPKVARLQEIIDAGEGIVNEIRRGIRSFAIPVARMGRQDILDSFNSPFFQSQPHYARAARLMRAFLDATAVVVEQGDAEGAKSIETIFEQWVFFRISAALQAAGLRCISHKSVFEPIARDRFSVDLDRNAAVDFEAKDGRIVRIRYEPTILPRSAAQGIDSLYRGHSESPWTPDIVLEILVPGNGPRDYRLAYAAVVDAKYTRMNHVRKRLQKIEKYREIRSVDSDSQIARQVWVAAPIEASIQPRDEAITWSSGGEVNADPGDVILGVVGADPTDPDGTGRTLRALVLGILNHAEAYALSSRSTVAQGA